MTWVDRTGAPTGTIGAAGPMLMARVSPDGHRVGWLAGSGPGGDLWVQDLPDGTASQLTEGHRTTGFAWGPASDRLLVDQAGSDSQLLWVELNSAHSRTLLPTTGLELRADAWSADGRWIAFEQNGQTKKTDLWLLSVRNPDMPLPAASSDERDYDGAFSPDSRWLAYTRDAAGKPSIFVQPFPAPGTVVGISPNGGRSPQWAQDGTALFYESLDGRVMSAGLAKGQTFHADAPRALFSLGGRRFQQPSSDNRHFLVLTPH
jgi:Tol biopolymer transport system component